MMDNTKATEHNKAVLLLIATALLWSTGGVLIKHVHWNPAAIAGTRSLLAIPLLLMIVKPKHLTFSADQIISCLGYTGNVILIVAATRYTTAANAIILQYMAPVFVALLGWPVLGEKARTLDWLMIGLCLAGLCLFFLDELAPGHLLGNILGIASGMFFAVYIIFMRKQKDAHPLGSVFLGNVLAAALVVPIMLTAGPPEPTSWIYLALLGVFQLGLAHIFYARAIKTVTAIQSSVIPFIEPVVNPLWVFLAIGERPGPWAITGGAIILLSVVMYSLVSITAPGSRSGRVAVAGTKITS